ncbi:terminase [Bordetella genomosp. 9]|uniref:Terminase n=2 Tax=Bordetella genomosp. 9 TaxID=1416803 RepID=A0A261RPP1_9BORD|nr:terminase [Bordetella genomosp. 9]
MTTVMRWLADNAVFREQYARAREAQADKLAEEILSIADDGLNDTYVDDEGNKRTDHDVVARSRLRVDARKWLASKMAPKKYGDKIEHVGNPEEPINMALTIKFKAPGE